MSGPWLILDRDDTILDDPGYLSDPNKIVFLPGALEGLQRFYQAGWELVVVTNQSGLGRGYFQLSDLSAVHDRFRALLLEHSIELAGLYHCPHAPDQNCDCRKPKVAMATQASEDLRFDLSEAVMVGDKPSDLEFGRNFGAKYVAQIVAKQANSELADGHFLSVAQLADFLLDPAARSWSKL